MLSSPPATEILQRRRQRSPRRRASRRQSTQRRHAGAIEPHEDDDVGQRVRPGHAHLVDDGVRANQHGCGDGPSQSRETGGRSSRGQSKPGNAAADREDTQDGEERQSLPQNQRGSDGDEERRQPARHRVHHGEVTVGVGLHQGEHVAGVNHGATGQQRPNVGGRQTGDEERRREKDGGRDHCQPARKELVVLALDDQVPAGMEAGGQQNQAERKEPHDRRFLIPRGALLGESDGDANDAPRSTELPGHPRAPVCISRRGSGGQDNSDRPAITRGRARRVLLGGGPYRSPAGAPWRTRPGAA